MNYNAYHNNVWKLDFRSASEGFLEEQDMTIYDRPQYRVLAAPFAILTDPCRKKGGGGNCKKGKAKEQGGEQHGKTAGTPVKKEEHTVMVKQGTHHLQLIVAGIASMALMLACLTGFMTSMHLATSPCTSHRTRVAPSGTVPQEMSAQSADQRSKQHVRHADSASASVQTIAKNVERQGLRRPARSRRKCQRKAAVCLRPRLSCPVLPEILRWHF